MPQYIRPDLKKKRTKACCKSVSLLQKRDNMVRGDAFHTSSTGWYTPGQAPPRAEQSTPAALPQQQERRQLLKYTGRYNYMPQFTV
jgi:hypothetical protein